MKINIKIKCKEINCNGELERVEKLKRIILSKDQEQIYIDCPMRCNKCGTEYNGKVLLWHYGLETERFNQVAVSGMG